MGVRLEMLKMKARKYYHQATDFDHMDCGRHLAEFIRPDIAIAKDKFNKIWKRIQKLDPKAPPSPLQ